MAAPSYRGVTNIVCGWEPTELSSVSTDMAGDGYWEMSSSLSHQGPTELESYLMAVSGGGHMYWHKNKEKE